MLSIEEVTTWTTEEAYAEVLTHLPKGCTFNIEREQEAGYWMANILDETGAWLWSSDPASDPRIAILNAYGWLHARSDPGRHPAWVRRGEIDSKVVTGRYGLPGVHVPDPEDLDPEEVERMRSGS